MRWRNLHFVMWLFERTPRKGKATVNFAPSGGRLVMRSLSTLMPWEPSSYSSKHIPSSWGVKPKQGRCVHQYTSSVSYWTWQLMSLNRTVLTEETTRSQVNKKWWQSFALVTCRLGSEPAFTTYPDLEQVSCLSLRSLISQVKIRRWSLERWEIQWDAAWQNLSSVPGI